MRVLAKLLALLVTLWVATWLAAYGAAWLMSSQEPTPFLQSLYVACTGVLATSWTVGVAVPSEVRRG